MVFCFSKQAAWRCFIFNRAITFVIAGFVF